MKKILIVLFIYIFFVGCALSNLDKVNENQSNNNFFDVVIEIDRGACFGYCPDYTITIYGNGTAIYNGRNYVYVMGPVEYQIPDQNIKDLVDYAYEIDYFSLEEEYISLATDFPSTTTFVKIGNNSKKIYNYDSGPKKLYEFEDKIDELANAGRWVGEPNGCLNKCGAKNMSWRRTKSYFECKNISGVPISGNFQETYGGWCCCDMTYSQILQESQMEEN